MIDERTEELASLYALDLLEDAERIAFENSLAPDPALQTLVRELRETTAAFALTAPEAAPSPALRARVLAGIGSTAAKTRPAATPSATILPFRMPAWIPWAAAAGFAIAAGWLGQNLLSTRQESDALRTDARLAAIARQEAENLLKAERIVLNQQIAETNRQLADARQQVSTTSEQLAASTQRLAGLDQRLAELGTQLKAQGDLAQFKIAALTSMLKDSPEAVAVALWNPTTQQGVLSVSKLPALAADKDYQLWVVDPAYPIPVDGGVFTVDPSTGEARVNFRPDKPVKFAAKFAISLERKGGVPKAEGPIVLFTK